MDISVKRLTNKIVVDYDKLARATEALRELGNKIVVTIGSWDLLHIGHVRYLINAKSHGDILVVGTDSDRAIKLYKGPLRPIIPEVERIEMVSYQSCVDYVTVVDDVDEKGCWQYDLIKRTRPDVFIAVEDSYSEEQKADIAKFCGQLVVLPRQAENTSTSKMIQDTLKKHLTEMIDILGRR